MLLYKMINQASVVVSSVAEPELEPQRDEAPAPTAPAPNLMFKIGI
jgi:hypothetical protein